MILKLQLSKFRNFKAQRFDFSSGTTVIVGPNASGKTNILEALYLLSTGKSFKARVEEEMIGYESDISRVKGKTGVADLEVLLTRGLIDVGSSRPEKAPRKRLLVNGVPKRLVDFAGNLKTVLFGPWDLDLVTEAPTLRRRFLDNAISQIDREYRRAILSYEKGLRQRNRLLFRIREEGFSRTQLLFWNQLLVRNGDYISQKRAEFIEFITAFKKTPDFKSGDELNADMSSSFRGSRGLKPAEDIINKSPMLNTMAFVIDYDRSVISEARLAQYAEEEIAAATTLVGPHRDDFVVKLTSRDLARFGSRGEQRMGVLWLKLAELEYIEEKTGERPTLLLDDIFSELDHEHRKIVVKEAENQQTIITTADPHFVENLKGVEKVELEG